MAIEKLSARNFLVFQRKDLLKEINDLDSYTVSKETTDAFTIEFSEKVNIFIGENGTGKTTLLKMLYWACEFSNKATHPQKGKNILEYFISGKKDSDILKNTNQSGDYSQFMITASGKTIEYNASHNGFLKPEEWLSLNINSVFVPAKEMLSHSKGFLAMNKKYNMPFDATLVDVVVNAELPETKEISILNERILNMISDIIDGTVIFEDDDFYVLKKNGQKLLFSLEAEGLRKFGLLWKLIRNGLIEKGTILFWDEPEANINPQLISKLVDILLELSRNGVQLFIATHDYNFAKYFEVKRNKDDHVIYHCLYKNVDGIICNSKAENYRDIINNPIEEAFETLHNDIIDKVAEDLHNE